MVAHFYYKKKFKKYEGIDVIRQIGKNISEDIPEEIKACIERGFALDSIISGEDILIISRNPVSFLKSADGKILNVIEFKI